MRVCSCSPATTLNSQDESLMGFVQQSRCSGKNAKGRAKADPPSVRHYRLLDLKPLPMLDEMLWSGRRTASGYNYGRGKGTEHSGYSTGKAYSVA